MPTGDDASASPFTADQPVVGKFKRAKATSEALNTTRALADPGYAYAVLEAYARGKLSRGRNKFQVQHKLDILERRVSFPTGGQLCRTGYPRFPWFAPFRTRPRQWQEQRRMAGGAVALSGSPPLRRGSLSRWS